MSMFCLAECVALFIVNLTLSFLTEPAHAQEKKAMFCQSATSHALIYCQCVN